MRPQFGRVQVVVGTNRTKETNGTEGSGRVAAPFSAAGIGDLVHPLLSVETFDPLQAPSVPLGRRPTWCNNHHVLVTIRQKHVNHERPQLIRLAQALTPTVLHARTRERTFGVRGSFPAFFAFGFAVRLFLLSLLLFFFPFLLSTLNFDP